MILMPCFIVSYAQVVVEKSGEKVIISGVAYYIHHVRKGETSYSISKAYGIKVDELIKENPQASDGVKTGQVLRIPLNGNTESNPVRQVEKRQHDELKYIYHILQKGETIYALSKSYGVTREEIILNNPGIDINKLSVGAEIAIPKKVAAVIDQKIGDQGKRYIYHEVLKGESLSSIARTYGIPVRELRRENRNIRFPQVGELIRIPDNRPAEIHVTEVQVKDTVQVAVEKPSVPENNRTGYSEIRNLSGTIDVAVLLPFYLRENSIRTEIDSSGSVRGRKVYDVIKRSDEWIYPGSFDFLEMYQGILLAADTLRSLGLNINLHTYDIKSDTVEITRLINSGALGKMDLIIGPVYSHNLSIVASYAKTLGIPVISPVPLINNSVLANNPTLFITNSSLEIVQTALAKKIAEYPDYNIVFIHTDTSGTDEDVKRFRGLILNELGNKDGSNEKKFRELLFYSRSMYDNDSINRLGRTLSDQSGNIVVIASEEAPVISETIMDIHGLSKRYNIKTFGYPAMKDVENLDPKYFFDLEISLYYQYWIDYTKSDVRKFNSYFRQIFLTEPSPKSFAWQGYDITYYFISGLAMHGKECITHPGMHHPDLLASDYDFMRRNDEDGFENQKLFLIQFTRDYEIKLAEEDDPVRR
jgi:LysM repeat protein